VAPHDGDVFEAVPGSRIMVIARGTERPNWDVNGAPLAEHDAHWILPLQRGRWTLRARSGSAVDRVTFIVRDPRPRVRREGFTIVNPGSGA
jgi:hypothetical protein